MTRRLSPRKLETVDSIKNLNEDLFASEEVDRLHDPIEARKKAMDFLARREFGRLELQDRLEAAGFGSEAARVAVDGLAGEGLQCDSRFVENFIQSRIDQGKGPVKIRIELGERKVASSLIDELLAGTDEDWTDMARRVREKKFGPELPENFTEKARQMRFLQQRGYESGQIQAAVAPHGDN
ncbi:MAG: regulatory protein RecX [Woeseia sp.]